MRTITFPRLAVLSVLALLAGCAAEPVYLEIGAARSFDPASCGTNSAISITSGYLDVGWTTRYFAFFSAANNLRPVIISSGQDVLSGQERNDIIVNTVHLHYVATPAVSIPDAAVPVHESIATGGQLTANYFGTDLITPAAAAALSAAAGAGTIELQVTVFFSGKTVGGSPVTSNPIVFPITVAKSTRPGCPPPGQPTLTVEKTTGGCYNPGQDNQLVNCIAP